MTRRMWKHASRIALGLMMLLPQPAAAKSVQDRLIFTVGSDTMYRGDHPSRMDVAPYVDNSRMMVPLRWLAEGLQLKLTWKEDTKTVIVTDGDHEIQLQTGSPILLVNGKQVRIDVPVQTFHDRTMIPLRAVTELFGSSVTYSRGACIISQSTATPEEMRMVFPLYPNLYRYRVFQRDTLLDSFETRVEAVSLAALFDHSAIVDATNGEWLWSNYPPFCVYQGGRLIHDFQKYREAIDFAKQTPGSGVYLHNQNYLVWDSAAPRRERVVLDATVILQNPELDRGCEVTALSMMLASADTSVDKLTLASEIEKVPYKENPHMGFAGDIYSYDNPGYGVYHEPIARLAEKYLPSQIVDLTGETFDDVLDAVSQGAPAWVITNITFAPLPPSAFQLWHTSTGDVQITWSEHSVLVTGYDNQFVYLNDPLDPEKNKKVDREQFIQSWEQMGSQAIRFVRRIK